MLGIPVTDLPSSFSFYQRLGFENVMESGFDYNGARGSVIMMKRGSMIMEIYQMPENELAEIRTRGNGHIDHIAFDVDNIDNAFRVLKESGFQIIEDAPVFLPFWKNGCKYFNVLGPDGERLEFNEIM